MGPPQSLAELEQKLAAELASRDVVLLSEIELSDDDVLWIAMEVAKRAAIDINVATDDLWRRFPATMALLLVWIGVYGYQQGDFWGAFSRLTRIPKEHAPVWAGKFRQFLEQRGLRTFSKPHPHRHLTPILAHSGIPDYCLHDFFRIIDRLVDNGWGSLDLPDAQVLLDEVVRSPQFRAADRPVREFLTEAGPVARSLVEGCIAALRGLRSGETSTDPRELVVPPRIRDRLARWFESEGIHVRARTSITRLRRPELYLDADLAAVFLQLPEQKLDASEVKGTPFLEVRAMEGACLSQLLTARRVGDVVLVDPTRVALEELSPPLTVSLKVGEHLIHRWSSVGNPTVGRCYVFGSDDCKAKAADVVPPEFWLLAPSSVAVADDWVVEDAGDLRFGGQPYRLYRLEFPPVEDQLVLKASDGTEWTLERRETEPPVLIGGERIANLFVGEEPVYTSLPSIRFLEVDRERRIRLRVTVEDGVRPLAFVTDDLAARGGELPISHLFERSRRSDLLDRPSLMQIDVVMALGRTASWRFAFLPRGRVETDPPFDCNLREGPIRVTLESAWKPVPLTGDEPQQTASGEWAMTVHPGTRELKFRLASNGPRQADCSEMVFTYRIPAVHVRVVTQPADSFRSPFSMTVAQLERLAVCQLQVRCVGMTPGELSLVSARTGHRIRAEVKRGVASFDLKTLLDSLRHASGEEDRLTLTVGRDGSRFSYTALTLRLERHQLLPIECSPLSRGQPGLVRVSVNQAGDDPCELLLWQPWSPWAPPRPVPLVRGLRGDVLVDTARLKPGVYFIGCLSSSNPWSEIGNFPTLLDIRYDSLRTLNAGSKRRQRAHLEQLRHGSVLQQLEWMAAQVGEGTLPELVLRMTSFEVLRDARLWDRLLQLAAWVVAWYREVGEEALAEGWVGELGRKLEGLMGGPVVSAVVREALRRTCRQASHLGCRRLKRAAAVLLRCLRPADREPSAKGMALSASLTEGCGGLVHVARSDTNHGVYPHGLRALP